MKSQKKGGMALGCNARFFGRACTSNMSLWFQEKEPPYEGSGGEAAYQCSSPVYNYF